MKSRKQDALHLLNTDQSSLADPCLASSRKLSSQIQTVKGRVLVERRQKLEEHQHLLELALNEAEALAWQSGFPELLFPVLAAEKAEAVTTWHARQEDLRQQRVPRAAAA
jgi:hypothetical protein